MKHHSHTVRYLHRRREQLTMRKIERLNTSFACWTDLVMWQFDTMQRHYHRHHRPYPITYKATRQTPDPACITDARNCGSCYCGKLATPDFLAEVRREYPSWQAIEVHP